MHTNSETDLPDRPNWSHEKQYSIAESIQRITAKAPIFYLAPEAACAFARIINDGQDFLRGNRGRDEHGAAWSERKMPIMRNSWIKNISITHDRIEILLNHGKDSAQVYSERGIGLDGTWYTNTFVGKRLAEEFAQFCS